jgi:hypothetical protein
MAIGSGTLGLSYSGGTEGDDTVRQAFFDMVPTAPKIVYLSPKAVCDITDRLSDRGQHI